ncbi:MAG: S8 family serine peptidase [Propionibacteriaceae bacterium]|nr:S8 family serine peptidase [Propionibacteriaceae bacterium]
MRLTRIIAAAGAAALVIPAAVASADERGGAETVADLVAAAPDAPSEELPLPSGETGPLNVMVELEQDPVAVVEAQTAGTLEEGQKDEIKSQIESAQNKVAVAIEGKGGTVINQLQSAYNGIRVSIDASELSALQEMPGVKDVHVLRAVETDNASSVPAIGTPGAWQGAGNTGYTGAGVKVAIVDTGVDYTHATFGGQGTPEAYAAAAAAADPSSFYGPRFKGGVDLAGDAYVSGAVDPQPDANPIDCESAGHGTHVAGTAVGSGVLSDGSTFAGPYDSSTYNNGFKVGPGVAPEADIYAVKIFGCKANSTDLVVDGIDWAVENGMDVINLSVGRAFGTAGDPHSVAIANAVASGVVVAVAAGNEGSQPYLANGPSVGNGALSVAAADGPRQPDGSPVRYANFSSSGPRWGDSALKPSVTAPGVAISSAAVGTGNGAADSEGTSMATPHVAGAAALAIQAHPEWSSSEVSAALVNTADPSKIVDYQTTRGGGLLDPAQAVATSVVALGDTHEVDGKQIREPSLSFGFNEISDTVAAERTVTLVNHGDSAVEYTGSVVPSSASAKAEVTLEPSTVTVPAGQSVDVKVTLTANAADIPSSFLADGGAPWFHEISGNVRFESGEQQLNVPYLMVPRSLSNVAATQKLSGATNTLNLTNSDVALDTKAAVLTWGQQDDPDDIDASRDVGQDLANVGVASAEVDGEQLLQFALNSETRYSNAARLTYGVDIDTNNDGTPEYRLISHDAGQVTSSTYNGIPAVWVEYVERGMVRPTGFRTLAPTDSSTVVLQVKASQLNITGKFTYSAWAGPMGEPEARDVIDGAATYDPSNKALQDGALVDLSAGGSQSVSVERNDAAVEDQKPLGLAVLALDNNAGVPELLTIPLGQDDPDPAEPTPEPTGDPSGAPTVTPTANPTGRPTPVPVKPGPPKTGTAEA